MNANASFAEELSKLGCQVEPGVALHPEPRELKDAEDAAKWLADLQAKGAAGWAQFSDANIEISTTKALPQGILLAAELYVSNGSGGTSHHLRHNGETWIATEIARTADPESFLETRSLLHLHSDGQQKRKLCYEVAWTGSPLRPSAFRFVGFKRLTEAPNARG